MILFLLGALAAALVAPAVVLAIVHDGWTMWLLSALGGFLVTWLMVARGWVGLRQLAWQTDFSLAMNVTLGGLIWAGMALVPAVMLAGTFEFEQGRVCTSAGTAIPGHLITQTDDEVLFAYDQGDVERATSVPADQVVQLDFGDLDGAGDCPALPPANKRNPDDWSGPNLAIY